jgi:hypothetical protein
VTNLTAASTPHDPEVHLQELAPATEQADIVNAVALAVIVVMLIPVYIGQRMAGAGDVTLRGGAAAREAPP